MQAQIEIEFYQLVELVKKLPQTQWAKLKQEVETQKPADKEREDFRNLLLNGPIVTKKQLEVIENNRKRINQWRTK